MGTGDEKNDAQNTEILLCILHKRKPVFFVSFTDLQKLKPAVNCVKPFTVNIYGYFNFIHYPD